MGGQLPYPSRSARGAQPQIECAVGEWPSRISCNNKIRASGLTLVVAAIILWNTVYLGRAIDDLKAQGLPVDDNLLEHLSPLGREHINLMGDHVWRQNRRLESGKFRPLRPVPVSIAVGMPIAGHPPHRSRRA
jgi:hypothetical protein